VADRLIERGVDNRLSPRLAVSRRQFGHAEGTAQAIYWNEVTGWSVGGNRSRQPLRRSGRCWAPWGVRTLRPLTPNSGP